MGIVYRAQQLDPRRMVALKMLLPHQLGSAEMADRFRLEVRTLTELEHPAILPVYQMGEYEALPFFTMKLATGGTLAQRREQWAGNWRSIAELVAVVADAVQFAHDRGVLHRDLKPGNILFDEQGRAYVSDFGLAKLINADSDLTRSLSFLGTPNYVAPEVAARSARQATTASDVYSLGAILYEMLAGRPPFAAEGIPALLKKIAEDEPVPPNKVLVASQSAAAHKSPAPKHQSPVPRDLEVICLKCLAKAPASRYASTRELAEDLRRWLDGRPILARPVSHAERAWRWALRNPGLAIVSVSLGLTLVIGGPLLWRVNRRLTEASRQSALAEAAALANLHAELLSQARALRRNGYDGHPGTALELIARAAKLRPNLETRNEAVATLAAGAASPPVLHDLSLATSRPQFPCTFDISSDDRLLLIGTIDSVQLLEVSSGRELWTTLASGLPWMYVFFHPDGKSLLYSARELGIVRREFAWRRDAATNEPALDVGEAQVIGRSYDSTIQSLGSGGQKWVVALDRDPIYIVRMDLWPDGRPEHARTIASGEKMTALALSPDGRWAASTTLPATDVRLWNAETGKSIGLLGAPGATLRQFSPDGRWLVTRNAEECRLWEAGTWKRGPAWTVPGGSHAMARISFSPDGRILALPQTISRFQFIDTRTYIEAVSLDASVQIYDAVWSHDGHHLYLLAVGDRVLDWDLAALRQQLARLGLDW